MKNILLIDDEEGVRKVLSISLRSDGYGVTTAENGEQGLKLFEKGSFPIVITDIMMPGLDGFEVLKLVKELNPDTEVIVFTGQGDMEAAIKSLQLGASDFITKPVGDQVLAVALKRAEERLATKRLLKEYTHNLENMVKDATEEIKRRYEFEDKLIHRSIDGIIATDKEGKSLVYNPAAEKIFGYTEDEAKSLNTIKDLYPEGIRQKIFDILSGEKKITEDVIIDKDTTVVGKNGEAIPIRFSGAILYESDTTIGSVGFFQDLREIKRLQKELIQSERSAAVGQTVAGLAHGIKNILNGLKGGVYIVNSAFGKMFHEGHKDTDEAGQDYLEGKLKTGWDMVERNIKRVSDLVLDLLSYSKEREPEYENYDPNIIANEVCELMQEKAKENNIEIVCGPGKDIGKVYLDPKGIHGSLLNLVSNAIDACIFDPDTEKKWKVQINVRQEEEGKVVFEVIDNGCGMDKEVRDRIFTEFFSTKGSRGTGLGLLVTQKIIDEHGGTINVDSQSGKGTKFTIRLPKNKPVNKK